MTINIKWVVLKIEFFKNYITQRRKERKEKKSELLIFGTPQMNEMT